MLVDPPLRGVIFFVEKKLLPFDVFVAVVLAAFVVIVEVVEIVEG